MKAATSIAIACLTLAGGAGVAPAQQMISAKAGLINVVEGQAIVDGKPLVTKPSEFTQLKPGSLLETGEGRSEVLLSPGSYLRLGENSAIRLTSDRISDPRLEYVRGLILVQCDQLMNDEAITVTAGQLKIALVKRGNYEIGGDPAAVKVFEGEARVDRGGQAQVVKKAQLLALDGVAVPQKFDASRGDPLYRWARRRAEYLAVANYSAANQLTNSRRSINSNSWMWDPYYGMFTFIPCDGVVRSAFGLTFWSPRAYYQQIYLRPTVPAAGFGGGAAATGGGYTPRAATSMGTSGTAAAAVHSAPTTSSGAMSGHASAGRETGSAGSRGK
jgi:hypothetical protein